MSADWTAVKDSIAKEWDATIVPALSAYVEVPNQSPDFDPEWATNGLMEKAFHILIDWMKAQNIKGLKYELLEEQGRTPFLVVEVDGTVPTAKTVLMYGHMDKQPPLRPWGEGLDPHKAVIRDGKLYGRGGADDGYAICAAIASIGGLQKQNIPHGRIVVIIEACEESGSADLAHYIDKCRTRIGDVDFMICLDSDCVNYDQLWVTTSLRGIIGGVLSVNVLSEPVHSGLGGGPIPDSFRITRELLNRVEDSSTGKVLIKEAHCNIPASVKAGLETLKDIDFKTLMPLLDGVSPTSTENSKMVLSMFWEPSLTVTGANLPLPINAGNVTRSCTQVKLAMRVAPLADAEKATAELKSVLEANPPYGAKVHFEAEAAGGGCGCPELKRWLSEALNQASQQAFGKPFLMKGIGGSIPFIGFLQKMFPDAQFVVTGVLGPKSNAHGPNEFLHIDYAKKLTFCIAQIVADHLKHTVRA